jgi:hypothetical protein
VNQPAFTEFIAFEFGEKVFYQPLDEIIASTHNIFANTAAAFRNNLQSVISTVFLPAKVVSVTLHKFADLLRNPTHQQFVRDLADPALFEPASELLRQGTVLTWTALEVLANDLFIVLLNFQPDLAVNLMSEEKTRRRFDLKNIPLETLARYEYDVSRKMGDLFNDKQPIDNTQTIREVFRVLLPESQPLRELLNAERLWRLYHRRNLIVHRKAIIDNFYLSNTSDAAPLNSTLDVTITDIQVDLELVRNIGIELLRALSARLRIIPVP